MLFNKRNICKSLISNWTLPIDTNEKRSFNSKVTCSYKVTIVTNVLAKHSHFLYSLNSCGHCTSIFKMYTFPEQFCEVNI